MTPIELRARREALGLNQDHIARILGVTQSVVSAWELGTRTPRSPESVTAVLDQLEAIQDKIIDEMCEAAEHSSAVLDTPTPAIRVYRADADYWADDPRAGETLIPAALHRTAAAWARRILREEEGIDAVIEG